MSISGYYLYRASLRLHRWYDSDKEECSSLNIWTVAKNERTALRNMLNGRYGSDAHCETAGWDTVKYHSPLFAQPYHVQTCGWWSYGHTLAGPPIRFQTFGGVQRDYRFVPLINPSLHPVPTTITTSDWMDVCCRVSNELALINPKFWFHPYGQHHNRPIGHIEAVSEGRETGKRRAPQKIWFPNVFSPRKKRPRSITTPPSCWLNDPVVQSVLAQR